MKKWLILLISVLSLAFIFTSCGEKGATYDYDLNDYVILGQYRGVEVSVDEIETKLQEQIDSLLSGNSSEEVQTEGIVEDGDIVNISYTGKLNGELFDGGSASQVDAQVGAGSYIDGFEQGLIGKSVGETVVLDLQFPEDYSPNPDLSGADVEFEITIHSKKVTVLPDYTDEFIAGLESVEQNTIEEYEIEAKKNIKNNIIWSTVMDSCEFKKYPEYEVKYYYDMMITQYENMAMYQYGTSLEAFITSYMGTDYDTFLTSILNTAKTQVQKDIVTYAIARAENISAQGDDYDELALKYAVLNGFETVEEYKDAFGQTEITRAILMDRIVNLMAAEAIEV